MSFYAKYPVDVTTINGLTGDITLAAGSNITLTPVGNTITIASSGGSSGANTTLSNLTSPTAINQNLVFLTGSAASLLTFGDVNVGTGSKALTIGSGDDAQATGTVLIKSGYSGGSTTGNIHLITGDGGGTPAGANTGNIALVTGASFATQGYIQFLKSGVSNLVGDVWTATATDGKGYWATPSSANRALSNLAAVAINASLLPATDNSITVGDATHAFSAGYINTLYTGADLSIDVAQRDLIDSGGTTVVGWNSKFLRDSSNVYAVRWGIRALLDSAGQPSMNWESRTLTNAATNDVLDYSGTAISVIANLLPADAGSGLYGNANLGSQAKPWGSGSTISDLGVFEIDFYDATGPSFSDFTAEMIGNLNLASLGLAAVSADLGIASFGLTGNGLGNTLGVAIATATSSSDSTYSQHILLNTGNATGATSDSGNITLQTGSATGARGAIAFVDGSEGSANRVWKSTGTTGKGAWDAAGASGSFTTVDLKTVTVVNGLITSIV